jgi:hypothetical protein
MSIAHDPDRHHPKPLHKTIAHTVTVTFSTMPPANDDAPVPPEPWVDPANDDAPVPPTCPACGRELFSRPTSMLIDLAVVAIESLAEIKNALETEVLP